MGLDNSVRIVIGGDCNKNDRAENDYYGTPPEAVEMLLDLETFDNNIWECACGEGNISKVLEGKGYNVKSSDLIDRGFGTGGVDFLAYDGTWHGDIITNPPYYLADQFIAKAIDIIQPGHKVCMFLKLQFLEGVKRKQLWAKYPLSRIYVSSGRLNCYKRGVKPLYKRGAICFAWYIWEKGYSGETILRLFN